MKTLKQYLDEAIDSIERQYPFLSDQTKKQMLEAIKRDFQKAPEKIRLNELENKMHSDLQRLIDPTKTYRLQNGSKYCLFRIQNIENEMIEMCDERTGKISKIDVDSFQEALNSGEIAVTAIKK